VEKRISFSEYHFFTYFYTMKLLQYLILPFAKFTQKIILNKHKQAVEIQFNTLSYLIKNSHEISFGKDHHFKQIKNYYDFFCHVNIRDYEGLQSYIERVKNGEKDVLWKGRPIYFAKTSGTTSGSKYIPITAQSIQHHLDAARNSLFAFVAETGKANFFSGKMIFLQGSPVLEELNGVKVGRLSGIVYHHVPAWLLSNRLPSYEANCLEDWNQKLEAIVQETKHENMTLLSGIPPWCVMYFEKLLALSNKENLKALFPNLELYIYGGVNYSPYKEKMDSLLGEGVKGIETYPASEGFFAYQDSQEAEGMLLNIDAGIFYEFVPSKEIHQEKPTRYHLGQVKLDEDYVLIVSTNAGLWAYNTGDTIRFVSLQPYRIKVTGRVKHFISAFGEHVIQEEVEAAISEVAKAMQIAIVEFTVAPYIAQEGAASYHEWFIEFQEGQNFNKEQFMEAVDERVQAQNSYYLDLRKGAILQRAKLSEVQAGGFLKYFEGKGKVGGQNKVQHLANNRDLANELLKYVKFQ
jgi:hypothetical protein